MTDKWICTKNNCNASNGKFVDVCYRCKTRKDWQAKENEEKEWKKRQLVKRQEEHARQQQVALEMSSPPKPCSATVDGKHPNNQVWCVRNNFENEYYRCSACNVRGYKHFELAVECPHAEWVNLCQEDSYSGCLSASEHHYSKSQCKQCGYIAESSHS